MKIFPPFLFRASTASLLISASSWLAGADEGSPQWLEPSDPAIADQINDAKATLQILVTNLSSALTQAVQEGGPTNGVEVCQTQAPALTYQSKQDGPSAVTAVKRTSLQVRNPANSPDPAEQDALDRVARIISTGKPLPPLLVQELAGPSGEPEEIRVYKPLSVAAQCLACHGDSDSFSADLRNTLAQRYPLDTATGYAEGDWRGLIRISVTP